MRPLVFVFAAAIGAFLASSLWPAVALARPTIRPFPVETLRDYAPMLAHSEMAVVESDAGGHARQMTMLGYTAAPPEMVHDLVAHPEGYPSFVHNLVRSDVERRPDGTMINRWRISYPIFSFEGTDEVTAGPGAAGTVTTMPIGKGKDGVFRWEFLPAPGGGTVVVDYGFYDPLDDVPLLAKMIKRNPAYESGFNLAGALTVMRSLLAEANRRAAAAGIKTPPPSGKAPGFASLLDRGTLAVVRSGPAGELVDVSVVERVPAPLPLLLDLLRSPEKWPGMMSSVKRVDVKRRDAEGIEYEMAVSGILLDVVTLYRMNFVPNGTDTLGVGGELKDARNRWDLSPAGPDSTVVVWRGNLHLGKGSALLRAMFKIEPSFEHAGNVSVGLISVRAMAADVVNIARKTRLDAAGAPSLPSSSVPTR